MEQIEVKFHPCLRCDHPTLTWYCEEHYLEKEANYAIYDLEHDEHYASEADKKSFRVAAVNKLLAYAKFKIYGTAK